MASIEDPIPPPHLIAASQLRNKVSDSHCINQQNQPPSNEGSRSPSGLFMKDFSYMTSSATTLPTLVEKNTSFPTTTNSIDFYQQKERHLSSSPVKDSTDLSVSQSPNKTTDSQKVQTLRSEISRLREEMLVKINALESEMSNRLPNSESRVNVVNQSGSSKEQSTQTDSTNETTVNDFSFEQNLVRTIDRKLRNLRDELFDKIDSVFSTSSSQPSNNTPESRNKAQDTQQPLTQHLQPTTTRTETLWPPLRKLSRDHRSEHETSRPNNNHHLQERQQRYESSTRPDNEVNRQRHEPSTTRSNSDYQRMYDTFNRKSPIPHHYSNAPVPVSRHVPTLINTSSVRPPHPATMESSSARNYYDTYSQTQSYQTSEQYSQTAREELARHLVDQLFPYDDLADANVRGVKGKRLLDPNKINKIRETVFRTYPVRSTENEEYLWKYICDKINAKCRGVTRTLKRKSAIWELENNPQSEEYMKSHSMKTLPYEHHAPSGTTKYRKESYGDFERCSFVPPSSAANESRLSRHQSSSDSDTSSVECAPGIRPWKSAPERVNAMAQYTPIERSSSATHVSCFSNQNPMKFNETVTVGASSAPRYERPGSSNSVKFENADSFTSSTKTLGEADEIDVEVKVIDEEEDNGSDDVSTGHCADIDENSSFDRSSLILQDSSSSAQSALELCDKLAEKYMENFHQDVVGSGDVISDKKRIQSNREEFTRTLIEAMFTRSTLAHSNVTGARGKFMLDPVKIAKVKETVFRKFPAENDDEEETVWKILTTKINTKCRGVKRLMKRKGIPSECIAKRYQGVLDDVNKQMVLGKEQDAMYPSVYEGDSKNRDSYVNMHSA